VIAASPSDRYALATAAGPQRDPFDCQVSRRLKVAAIGSATRAPQALACVSPTTRWPVATPWIPDDQSQSPGTEQTGGDKDTNEVAALHAYHLCNPFDAARPRPA